jgi:hypothetical protein
LIGWGRRRGSWWVAIVLPGFLLRSLIPIGFMPAFGPGLSARLMLCEGYAPVPSMFVSTAMDMSSDMPMPMDMPMAGPAQHDPAGDSHSGGNHTPTHQDHSACPYGASPALAAPPLLAVVPPVIQPSPQALRQTPQVAHYQIAARAQSPRGPPLPV